MIRPDPGLARALTRWQHAAGPYWPFVCAVPFLAEPARRAARPRAVAGPHPLTRLLAAIADGPPVAAFVDLPPTRVLPLAPELNRLGFYAVPVIQRWVASPAVLSCSRLVAQLVTIGEQLHRPRCPRGVVFLLDGDRAGPPGPRAVPEGRGQDRFDNRYAYPVCRFPTPDFLRSEGIERVWWIGTVEVAADLRAYAGRLAEGGLTPEPRIPVEAVAEHARAGAD